MEELTSLIVRARSGELTAYGEIIRRFQDMAYGYAYSMLGDFHLAEDAAQEAFIQAYRDLSKLREPAAFPGWFRRIVLKHCDRLTRGEHIPTRPLSAASGMASKEPNPAEAIEKAEIEDAVLAAIRSLPEVERSVTTLFYINGYSQEDIAGFLELPVTTVNNRLHASRKRLKERMMVMVENTLKEHALPDNFADRLIAFPFPHIEPPVKIVDLPGEKLAIRCADMQYFFVPLVEHGACDWTFYDWPGGRLTGVYEYRVIDTAKHDKRSVFRIWHRYTEIGGKGEVEWREWHILVEDDLWCGIDIHRAKPGELRYSDLKPWVPPDDAHGPVPMKLSIGAQWDAFIKGDVVGVSQVTIGERTWKCLKVVSGKAEPARTYAEWYVAETSRTVFFRRYNGPEYRKTPDQAHSFESLAGNMEVVIKGKTFRHFYDCIPDIALEKTFR